MVIVSSLAVIFGIQNLINLSNCIFNLTKNSIKYPGKVKSMKCLNDAFNLIHFDQYTLGETS